MQVQAQLSARRVSLKLIRSSQVGASQQRFQRTGPTGHIQIQTPPVRTSAQHVLAALDDELAMLDSAFFVKPNSRLGCQLKIKEEMDGLKLELAPVGG